MCNHLNKDEVCKDKFCKCIHIVNIKLNDMVEFIVVDATQGTTMDVKHPMHLHGHKFAVVAMHDVYKYFIFKI